MKNDLTIRQDPEALEQQKIHDIMSQPIATPWSSRDPIDIALRSLLTTSLSAIASCGIQLAFIHSIWILAVFLTFGMILVITIAYYRLPFRARAGLMGAIALGLVLGLRF